ncbi:MAG: pimeloyl-ACP methyl ester esterase BioH [Gammaproteobacteria bacterium]|jgi:pimeloyl-[acyl-carrier protein] methyl ester esterase
MWHAESRGSGPDLVLVHGWGMHSGIWSEWADRLAHRFRVHLVDLPGHGRSGPAAGSSLDDWSAAVAAQVPERAWWLGWSLGGLVALNTVRLLPDRVCGLVLVASTPRFVTAPDWPSAVDPEVFKQFSGQLRQSVDRTLSRFLSLQIRGSDGSGDLLRGLRAALQERPYPAPEALIDGLKILQRTDLRNSLSGIEVPLYWLFGERDTLVPAPVAERVPGVRECVAGAGHAPFLSHPDTCTACIDAWLLRASRAGRHAAG